jgi:hypothetical protein
MQQKERNFEHVDKNKRQKAFLMVFYETLW